MGDITTGSVPANGLDFGYLAAGPQDGPLALLLHGFPDSAHSWRHLMPDLAAAGYRAVAPFMRGYAPTSVPEDGAYQSGALAADAVALHEALGGGPDAVVVGHDWGAFATYGAVNAAPDRWRKAVVMSVPPVSVMTNAFLDYEQLRRSFYIFVFQTPLAEVALGRAFVEGLWRDWSPTTAGTGPRTSTAPWSACARPPTSRRPSGTTGPCSTRPGSSTGTRPSSGRRPRWANAPSCTCTGRRTAASART